MLKPSHREHGVVLIARLKEEELPTVAWRLLGIREDVLDFFAVLAFARSVQKHKHRIFFWLHGAHFSMRRGGEPLSLVYSILWSCL